MNNNSDECSGEPTGTEEEAFEDGNQRPDNVKVVVRVRPLNERERSKLSLRLSNHA